MKSFRGRKKQSLYFTERDEKSQSCNLDFYLSLFLHEGVILGGAGVGVDEVGLGGYGVAVVLSGSQWCGWRRWCGWRERGNRPGAG